MKTELHSRILSTLENGSAEECLKRAFLDIDSQWVVKANSESDGPKDGSTAVVALILDGTLLVANVGDSEAIAVRWAESETLEVTNMTSVHKANAPEEKKRIQDLGGKVFFGRVFGMLAVSRAFGDIDYKKPRAEEDYVVALPAISSVKLDMSYRYSVVAATLLSFRKISHHCL